MYIGNHHRVIAVVAKSTLLESTFPLIPLPFILSDIPCYCLLPIFSTKQQSICISIVMLWNTAKYAAVAYPVQAELFDYRDRSNKYYTYNKIELEMPTISYSDSSQIDS